MPSPDVNPPGLPTVEEILPASSVSSLFVPSNVKGIAYIVIYGPDWAEGEKRFELLQAEVRVGRGSDADIRLEDRSVSRIQAKLILRGDRYSFFDFRSRNGAFLNGEPIDRKTMYPLDEGAEIRIAPYRIVFHRERRSSDGHLRRGRAVRVHEILFEAWTYGSVRSLVSPLG